MKNMKEIILEQLQKLEEQMRNGVITPQEWIAHKTTLDTSNGYIFTSNSKLRKRRVYK